MLQQPRPDYIVKPMPTEIPTFEIAPLERARTDRAANSARFAGETAAQAEFRNDGRSDRNVAMMLVAIVMLTALATAAGAALYGAVRGIVAAYAFGLANPAVVGFSLAGVLAVLLCGLIVYRIRAGRPSRPEAADTGFGELA